jgi:hypothetical protein
MKTSRFIPDNAASRIRGPRQAWGALMAVLFTAFAVPTPAAPAIAVGNIQLLPDKPNQTVQVFVSGGDVVQGLNFEIQTGDGGPDSGGTAAGAGPLITNLDLLTGTIFAANNTGQHGGGPLSLTGKTKAQVWEATTTTSATTVAAAGLLANITFDTTGFKTINQSFPLALKGTNNGDTNFAGVPINITNGTITIVPEPGAVGLVLAMGIMGLRRRRRGLFRETAQVCECTSALLPPP